MTHPVPEPSETGGWRRTLVELVQLLGQPGNIQVTSLQGGAPIRWLFVSWIKLVYN